MTTDDDKVLIRKVLTALAEHDEPCTWRHWDQDAHDCEMRTLFPFFRDDGGQNVELSEDYVRGFLSGLVSVGLIDGCGCGCRGDWQITGAGRLWLAKHGSFSATERRPMDALTKLVEAVEEYTITGVDAGYNVTPTELRHAAGQAKEELAKIQAALLYIEAVALERVPNEDTARLRLATIRDMASGVLGSKSRAG
jgi:hypothetical protein